MKFPKHYVMIELFSGSGEMSEGFAKMGFRTFEVDFDESMNPDKVADILELLPSDLPKHPWVIWASPDCTYFSLANNKGHHFAKGGEPLSEQAKHACRVVERTIWLIEQLNPTYWFIENPRGHLRAQPFMKRFTRTTVQYCAYGASTQKPTDIWGVFPALWHPLTRCYHNGHEMQIGGNNDLTPKSKRALIPQPLITEIVESVIRSQGVISWPTLEEWT